MLLAAILLAGWWWLFPTVERQVRAASRELADAVSSPATESDVARLARLARASRYLAPDIAVEAAGGTARLDGREAVIAALNRIGQNGEMSVTFGPMTVAVDDASDRATVRTSVTLVRNRNPETSDTIVVALTWQRAQEGWQLAHAMERVPTELEP